jgi:SAM-dependent methyltransferase
MVAPSAHSCGHHVDRRLLEDLLKVCAWPSEALWRYFELQALRTVPLENPVLEIGCGDGSFTSLLGVRVDLAIDLNARAARRASERWNTYGRVICGDIRSARLPQSHYQTVFANSVFEHIEGLPGVLAVCTDILAPTGSLVVTVPTASMNRHLLSRRAWYLRMRNRQLQHRNLWSEAQWKGALSHAGFSSVEANPYLPGTVLRAWDAWDLPAWAGLGRVRVGPLAGSLKRLVQGPDGGHLFRTLADHLTAAVARAYTTGGEACALVMIARP